MPAFSRINFGLAGFTAARELHMLDKLTKNRLLSRKEAAEYLGVKEVTLAIWKSAQRHPIPVVKVGRLAKYRFGDLLEFVEKRTVNKEIDTANDY